MDINNITTPNQNVKKRKLKESAHVRLNPPPADSQINWSITKL